MRSDENLARSSFRFSPEWKRSGHNGELQPHIDARLAGVERRGDTLVVHSLSGNERNHYFANQGGRAFKDISALSGLDNPADGRGFAVLDYDRDGWQDVALVNANQPMFNLYHNEMPSAGHRGGMIAIRFVGGNRSATPSSDYTSRDGYGARITAEVGDQKLIREHRCGDGFSSQNSATMILGIGGQPVVRSIQVRWPSGKIATTTEVPEGAMLTVYENPADAPAGEAFVRGTYRTPAANRTPPAIDLPVFGPAVDDRARPADRRLHVYTTIATWCPSCKKLLPAVQWLHQTMEPEGVDFVATPIDPEDDDAKLAAYAQEHHLPSRLAAIPLDQREHTKTAFARALGADPPLPTTVVTDPQGRILLAKPGVPTVSELRRLLKGR